MIFLTVINIYTVRIVLNALGVENYGIYSVIGSAVYMLGFVQGTLTSATQRYFSYQLANKDSGAYSRLFSLVMICFLILSGLILIIGGSFGPFVVKDFLNIPSNRTFAGLWVYYSTLGTFVLGLLTIPYSASMISHEKMTGFAYLSIFDGLFKLGVAFLVMYSPADHLILYAILTFLQSLITFGFYAVYSRKKFEGVRFNFQWERTIVKELLGYTGWNLFGSVSSVLTTSGQGVVLNLFFGPLINTAKGIADRISSVVQSFSTNFYLAVSPQIIKSYATGEIQRMVTLVVGSSKFSFFLLLIIGYPLIICMDGLLSTWLGSESVSPEMIIFCRLTLVYCLISCLEQPITQIVRATGKIRNYQVSVGIFTLAYLPIAIGVLYLGAPAQSTMYVLIIMYSLLQILRVAIVKRQVNFPVGIYLKGAILPILIVTLLLTTTTIFLLHWPTDSLLLHLLKGLISFAIAVISILIFGLKSSERKEIMNKLRSRLVSRKSSRNTQLNIEEVEPSNPETLE